MTLLLRLLVFVALTLITQIGGIVYLLCHAVAVTLWRRQSLAGFWALFAVLYVGATAFVVPPLARQLGRTPIACEMPWEAASTGLAVMPHACLLNRHYLRFAAARHLADINAQFAARHADSRITVLETGFPFLDGFPLLPHLSHHDGRKADVAFFYREKSSGSPSPVGFFVVEPPRTGDAQPCAERWTPLRWSFWWLDRSKSDWRLDEARTAELVKFLAAQESVERLLLEPHLVARLNVADPKVRFQGCQAARHDDHIHVSFK